MTVRDIFESTFEDFYTSDEMLKHLPYSEVAERLHNELVIQGFHISVWEKFDSSVDGNQVGTVHLYIKQLTNGIILKNCAYTYVNVNGVSRKCWVDCNCKPLSENTMNKCTHYMRVDVRSPDDIEYIKRQLKD